MMFMGLEKENPEHVKWDYYPMGLGGSISGDEANGIIEEITAILISKKITVYVAKQILQDTITALDNEALLEKRIINGEIK